MSECYATFLELRGAHKHRPHPKSERGGDITSIVIPDHRALAQLSRVVVGNPESVECGAEHARVRFAASTVRRGHGQVKALAEHRLHDVRVTIGHCREEGSGSLQ